VKVHFGEGKASLTVKDFALTDWKTTGNSLTMGKLLGPGVDATVSLEINWSGVTRKVKVRDAKVGFAGRFLETGATMTWSASQKSQLGSKNGFEFVSDAAKTTKTNFAQIGHERNGVFFDKDDDDDDDDDDGD
jgi:hypothetical protein